MRIYSNKKRPVKASSNGRKWVNTELTQDEYAKFRNFLKKKGYKYETSGAGDMVHIEAYLNEAEIKEADNFLDTLDDVNGACGKKSVKADSFLRHTRKSDDGTFSYTIDEDKLYYGVPGAYFVWKSEWGDPWVEYDGGVYYASDLDSGVYSDFEDYCKENGITDWRDEDNAFDAWAEENGRDSAEGWLYDMSPFAEVIETSGNYRWAKEIGVNASTKRRRSSKAVNASETSVTAAIDDGMHIIIDSKAYVDVTEDDFEQGEVGPYVNSWEFDVRGEYNSIGELVRAISENSYVFSEDVGDYYYMDGSIRTSATVDVDNSKPTDAQIDAWQRGEEKLYVADMYLDIKVGTVHEMTEDEARDFGISIY